ncbi:MAG: glycosyltransferase [Lachnospiraceae bacterium]|nr:glycosyltransferase [Lachnospiraceae bacterium]
MGKINPANVKKTWYYLKRNGLQSTWYAAKERLEEGKQEPYVFRPVSAEVLEEQKKWAEDPFLFSILVPAYRTGEGYLRELVASLQDQSYPYWELILADATEDDSVKKVIDTYADSRICYVKLPGNRGISENTNEALQHAAGKYIGLLDHDDILTPDALYEMAAAVEKGKKAGIEVKMLYSDEDKCDGEGKHFYEPNRKEKFNLDLLLSNNYICHLLVMESGLIKELGFRKEYDGAQDYDLVLRGAGKLMGQEEQIVHIPKVLYHWRCHEDSTAQNPQSKQYAYDAGLRALQDFADARKWKARAIPLKHLGFYQLLYEEGPLKARKDVGAVGGRLLSWGRTMGGRMTKEGEVYYKGLPKAYSGYLHRAALTQDAEALDIRCIQVKEELYALFEEVTEVPYRKFPGTDLFDASTLPEGTDYTALSLKLSKAVREAGYRLLYTPDRAEKWNAKKRQIDRR